MKNNRIKLLISGCFVLCSWTFCPLVKAQAVPTAHVRSISVTGTVATIRFGKEAWTPLVANFNVRYIDSLPATNGWQLLTNIVSTNVFTAVAYDSTTNSRMRVYRATRQ